MVTDGAMQPVLLNSLSVFVFCKDLMKLIGISHIGTLYP